MDDVSIEYSHSQEYTPSDNTGTGTDDGQNTNRSDADSDADAAYQMITKGSPVEKRHVDLCSDKVKSLYALVVEFSSNIDKVNRALSAMQNETLDNEVGLGVNQNQNQIENNTFWLQLTYRSLSAWDVNAVGKSSRRKFTLASEKLVGKVEELETSVTDFLELFHIIDKDMTLLKSTLKIFPDINLLKENLPAMRSREFNPVSGSDYKFTEIHVKREPKLKTEDKLLMRFPGPEMEISWNTMSPNHEDNKLSQHRRIVLLRNLPEVYQSDLLCHPIFQLIRTVNKIIIRMKATYEILQECSKIKEMRDTLLMPSVLFCAQLPKFQALEGAVIAVLTKTVDWMMESTLTNFMNVENRIGEFTRMVQCLQIHAAGKKLVDDKLNDLEQDHLKIFLDMVDYMADEFEVKGSLTKREYIRTLDNAWQAKIRLEDPEAKVSKYPEILTTETPTASSSNVTETDTESFAEQ